MVMEDMEILKAVKVTGLIPYSNASFPKIPMVPHIIDAEIIKK